MEVENEPIVKEPSLGRTHGPNFHDNSFQVFGIIKNEHSTETHLHLFFTSFCMERKPENHEVVFLTASNQ